MVPFNGGSWLFNGNVIKYLYRKRLQVIDYSVNIFIISDKNYLCHSGVALIAKFGVNIAFFRCCTFF